MAAPSPGAPLGCGGDLSARSGSAAVLTAPRTIEIVDRRIEEPADGEILVTVEGCGVCGSNLPVWEGRPWFTYPLDPGAPGHEGWGTVDRVADGVTGVAIGDRVAFLGDRAFADTAVARADQAVVLPADPAFDVFPGEALGCGFNVAARSGFASGQTVAVVGVGFLGAVVVGLAAAAGARVLAISRRPYALDVARDMGATEAIPLDASADGVDVVRDLTGGNMCDIVVEAVGQQAPLDLAGRLARLRGRLVIAGFHQDGPRTVDLQHWNWQGLDVVNAHERDPAVAVAGMRAAVAATVDGTLDPSVLLTHHYPLDQLDRALDAAVDRPDGFLKAVVLT